jgi:uncharacterized membrane protein
VSARGGRPERLLTLAITVAVIDTIYLSWRYLALHAGWVTPGTGICSWTAGIDCDQVLLTPQARAFYTPNALLGLGFYLGCALFWWRARALGPEGRPLALRFMAGALTVGTAFTVWFWWLLVHLDHLCPFCPWNHAFNWLAMGAAWVLIRREPLPTATSPAATAERERHLRHCFASLAVCLLQGVFWQLVWYVPFRQGLLTP